MFTLKKIPTTNAQATVDAGDNVFLVDVREIPEWEAGHALGATNAPLSELESLVTTFPHDRKIVFVCRSGRRSREATIQTHRKGFDVANLEGGMAAWVASGFEIVNSEGSPGRIL